jgi:hypothetical protein
LAQVGDRYIWTLLDSLLRDSTFLEAPDPLRNPIAVRFETFNFHQQAAALTIERFKIAQDLGTPAVAHFRFDQLQVVADKIQIQHFGVSLLGSGEP